jgi:hypothetical protein
MASTENLDNNPNIEMRNKGYHDGEQGIEPLYPESDPYMDGHRLGALVRMADKAQRQFGQPND